MTSKVQPAADCWTDDIKMTSEVQPTADNEPLKGETWELDCFIFGEQKRVHFFL